MVEGGQTPGQGQPDLCRVKHWPTAPPNPRIERAAVTGSDFLRVPTPQDSVPDRDMAGEIVGLAKELYGVTCHKGVPKNDIANSCATMAAQHRLWYTKGKGGVGRINASFLKGLSPRRLRAKVGNPSTPHNPVQYTPMISIGTISGERVWLLKRQSRSR